MVYRRTTQVVKRLAARRSAILAAARETCADGGMAAVQIAPVAIRANVAAGTVYRYFPSKADLISELIADVSRDELAAIRRAADAAPGPSSALAAAVTTVITPSVYSPLDALATVRSNAWSTVDGRTTG